MPTIQQLPSATSTSAQDELPVIQAGVTRAVTVAELLSGTQQAIELGSPSILGRASLGPGGPEALAVGAGLFVQNAAVAANGGDHAGFVQETAFAAGDEAIINAAGIPKRLPVTAFRALFTGGANVSIDTNGVIAASTDPSVSSSLTTLGQGLSTADAGIAALAAKIPSGGVAALNSSGQVTAPIAGDASLGTVLTDPSGVARTLAGRANDVINVLDFGAVLGGSQSGPDCTSAFNAAVAQLPSSGGELFVPAGDYWLQSSVVITGKPCRIRGAGRGQTRIHVEHSGIGFDFAPGNLLSVVEVTAISLHAESTSGQTAAGLRVVYPTATSFGYVTTIINEVEFFGRPNPQNGMSPFPQTFLRGVVLMGCWSTQISNISWFGPPATAGATSSAAFEINGSVDTRIQGAQAYYGQALVVQTGYCEGLYISNPLVVGTDYLLTQTAVTGWAGYSSAVSPPRKTLLGLWVSGGEVNTSLGTVLLSNVTDIFIEGLDITRDTGPNTQTLFNLTDVTNLHVSGCNFVGGPSNGNNTDVAFSFASTYDSSSNIIEGCHFENMATIIQIDGPNGTVGLTTYGLQYINVPQSTAFIDNSAVNSGNFLTFQAPAQANVPAGLGATKDHVFSALDGNPIFQIQNIAGAANFIAHQPATASNPATICFTGTDNTVNGVIQTKGGNLFVNAAGGTSGSGNLVSLINTPGASNWVVIQNATASNLSLIETNAGGLALQPKTTLWLAPGAGLFAPGLPTVKPAAGSGQLWNNGGVVSIA